MDDSELPLQFASGQVWEDFSRMRDQIQDVRAKRIDDDKAKLQAFQVKIEIIHSQGPYASQQPSQSYRTGVQASGSSPVAQPRQSSPEPKSPHDISGHTSASTAVAPDQ